jgi:ribose transport system ATP-binding protein
MNSSSIETTDAVLELRGVEKRYGNTVALHGAGLQLRRGETTGLVGENGAGKSTLVRVVSGLVQPDAGEIVLDGQVIELKSVAEARDLGVATVFQDLSFIPDLTVAENLLLAIGRKPWIQSRRRRILAANELAEEWGLSALPTGEIVSRIPLRDRQLLEILGAIARRPRVLILDEPTSSLLPGDIEWVLGVVQKLKESGTAILFISHVLDEVERFCSSVTIQRNGKEVATYPIAEFERSSAIEQMIGRSFGAAFPVKTPPPEDVEVLLSVEDLVVQGSSHPVSFQIHAGEIVGVVALEGQGQRRIFEALAGAEPPTSGRVELAGNLVRLRTPRSALGVKRMRGGISFVPPERKIQGLVLDMSVRKNISLPLLPRLSKFGIINDTREGRVVDEVLAGVQVAATRVDDPVRQLSGGNQQKVVFARAVVVDPQVLLMYDPTRGVDVGTKFELYRIIQQLAESGRSILLYSTEIPEIVNLCHRVLVVYDGQVMADIKGANITESSLMAVAIGAISDSKSDLSGSLRVGDQIEITHLGDAS